MDIIKKFNLPTFVKGKSFSEASALIAKRFEGRNSPEDIATLNELQGRLQQAQEFVKAEQEKRTRPQQVATVSSQETGAEPLGSEPASNQYEGGGGIFASLKGMLGGGGGEGAEGAGGEGPGVGGYMQAAGGAMELANMAFGDKGIDTSGATAAPDVPSKGASTAMGAMKGAQAGKAFGPWGTAIGGVLGGAAGFIGGGKAQEEAQEADVNYDLNLHNKASNSYKSGGQLLANMYEHGGPHNTDNPYADTEALIAEMRGASNKSRFAQMGLDDASLDAIEREGELNDLNEFSSTLPDPNINPLGNDSDVTLDPAPENETKFNPTELLRYAPAAMNLAQLANLKKPDKVGLDRLGNKYEEQLVDEKGLQNVVQEGVLNTRDALIESSGGSGSTARANLLASQLQGQKAQSQAYQQAGAENRQEKRKAQEFDLGVDQTNLGQSNQEKNINLQLEAGYQTNKSKLMSQLGDDLGGIGQEELFKRYPELMGLSYGSKGQHLASEKKKKAAKKAARKQKN